MTSNLRTASYAFQWWIISFHTNLHKKKSGKNDEDLFDIISASSYGLFASIFTKNLSRAFRYSEKLKCGNVNVNDMRHFFRSNENNKSSIFNQSQNLSLVYSRLPN